MRYPCGDCLSLRTITKEKMRERKGSQIAKKHKCPLHDFPDNKKRQKNKQSDKNIQGKQPPWHSNDFSPKKPFPKFPTKLNRRVTFADSVFILRLAPTGD